MKSAKEDRKIRVLLAKFELESHDREIFLVSKILRDAGIMTHSVDILF